MRISQILAIVVFSVGLSVATSASAQHRGRGDVVSRAERAAANEIADRGGACRIDGRVRRPREVEDCDIYREALVGRRGDDRYDRRGEGAYERATHGRGIALERHRGGQRRVSGGGSGERIIVEGIRAYAHVEAARAHAEGRQHVCRPGCEHQPRQRRMRRRY